MPITTRSIDDATVLDLTGLFDVSAKQEVQCALDHAFEAGSTHVILNLAGVPLVDSAALGLLAINHKKFKAIGGTISLLSPQPEVRLILDMAAMPKLIPSYGTLQEALAQEKLTKA
jgi:stage II sporulation protein AA (anti-sigma F factor antagonist)